MRWLVTALAIGFLLVGCGGDPAPKEAAAQVEEEKPLQDAYELCKSQDYGNEYSGTKISGEMVLSIEDETSLVVNGFGDQFVSVPAATCVLEEIDVSAAIRSQIESTTSLMGRQSGAWDDYEATWSFHPDNGLDMVIELVED